jgi:hypothetical protein
MIDLHLVVQRQRVIALAPVVADARLAIDDQRVDLQLGQPRRDREPGLPAADHQHGRVAVRIGGGCLAQIEPVRAAEVARVGLPGRPRLADALLVALDRVERGQQRPGLGALRAGGQPQHAAAAPCAVSNEKIASIARRRRASPGAARYAADRAGSRRPRSCGGAERRRDRVRPVHGPMSQVNASTSRQ